MCGTVLVRFLELAQQAGQYDQMVILGGQIEFVLKAISKVGERVPVSHSQAMSLRKCIAEKCGPHFSSPEN